MGRLSRSLPCSCVAIALVLPLLLAAEVDSDERHLDEVRVQAEHGSVARQIELGSAYLTGRGVSRDYKKAAHWYELAARSGDAAAENEMGYFYQTGIGVPVDVKRAAHWFQLASASGLVLAKVNLGISYLRGLGVRQDAGTARLLLQEALKKGSGLAATYLGDIELFGIDGPVDQAKAESWFETGSRLHDPESDYNLAYFLSLASNHAHDFPRAAKLLRESAEKGYVPAKHALGLLLVNHPDLSKSPAEGRGFFEQASSAGYWKASVILGVLARDGRGATTDLAQAWYYFRLATLQGGTEASELLRSEFNRLGVRVAAEEQAVSGSRAEAWYQQHPDAMTFSGGSEDHNDFPAIAFASPAPGRQ